MDVFVWFFLHEPVKVQHLLLCLADTGGGGPQAGPGGVCPSHHARTGHLYVFQNEEEDGFPLTR